MNNISITSSSWPRVAEELENEGIFCENRSIILRKRKKEKNGENPCNQKKKRGRKW